MRSKHSDKLRNKSAEKYCFDFFALKVVMLTFEKNLCTQHP